MTKGSAVIKYPMVIGVVAVVLLAAVSGPYESFEAWYGQEGWQIAGGVDLIVVLALTAFAAFFYRRWGEGRHESAERIRSAGQRDQQRNLCEELLALQSKLGQGLVIIEDDRIQYANEAFCEISGYSLKELKTLPGFTDLTTEGERASISEEQRRGLGRKGVETHSATLRRKDGQRVEVEVVSKGLEGAGSSKSVAIVRSTTGQNRAEEARDDLATVIESAGDAITSSTLEGVIIGWNPGAERLYGYSADEAIGKTVRDVMGLSAAPEWSRET